MRQRSARQSGLNLIIEKGVTYERIMEPSVIMGYHEKRPIKNNKYISRWREQCDLSEFIRKSKKEMGCCLSAGKVTTPPVNAAKIPPPIEEESVKEVVVQSVSVPVAVSVPVPVPVPDIVPSEPTVSDSEAQPPLSLSTPTPEISHNKSDICSVSVSHSFSTATTATAASILEDDALSKPHRPPPPSSTYRRNRPDRVSRSPAERHSPQGKLRPRLVRERPSRQPSPTHNRRNVDSGSLPRSGLSNNPRRRSQSPAIRGPSSARRSPMKKREGAPLKGGEAEVKKKEEEAKADVEVKKEDVVVRDPEVSMECFIFL